MRCKRKKNINWLIDLLIEFLDIHNMHIFFIL